ncbi:HEAT repeat domain-containing protein [Fimbriiglobus ruber]|uniref:HEAT repeat domain-containing protein n=1 Tax=Fimbriiglobus ruber TaxID=1908690 RepID=UPI00137947BB|nr:HEAT repeat domain-containing protein [Fimbriiglobus ruber]
MSIITTVLVLSAATASVQAAPPGADETVVRRLVEALKDPDLEVRQNIGLALAKIGPAAVELLTEALKDAIPERRAGAAYALSLLGPTARPALPALLDALGDKEVDVRRQVSYAISRVISSGPQPRVPAVKSDPPVVQRTPLVPAIPAAPVPPAGEKK